MDSINGLFDSYLPVRFDQCGTQATGKNEVFYNLGGCMPSSLTVKGIGLASKLSSNFY